MYPLEDLVVDVQLYKSQRLVYYDKNIRHCTYKSNMDTLNGDSLQLVILELDLTSVLALAQVNRITNKACELSWSLLYERQYNRGSPQPKSDYKRNVFSAGVVMRYWKRGGSPELVLATHVKKYTKMGSHEICITVDNECTLQGEQIETDVLDIAAYTYDDVLPDQLFVLTKTEFVLYGIWGTSITRDEMPLTNGKRILRDDYDGHYCETLDGRFFCAILPDIKDEIPLNRITRQYVVMIDGEYVQFNALAYNVRKHVMGMKIIMTDKMIYIIGEIYPTRVIEIEALACISDSTRDLIILTKKRELVRYHWRDGSISTIDTQVLCMTTNEEDIFYIRCML